LSEIDILRDMDHEHIIKMYEVYESDKFIHMVLELLTGGELFDKIR
jgi:serine/threonine protein kinase